MLFTLFRLSFTTPLHISNPRSDYAKSETIIHSDTLYSAVFEAWSVLGKTNLIQAQISDLQFAITSLFPFTKDDENEYVYFFPKPMNMGYSNVPQSEQKTAKKVEFIDKDFFEKLRKEGSLGDYSTFVKGKFLTQKNITSEKSNTREKSITTDFIQSEVFPRVRIPRDGGDAEPYYVDRIFFKENSGLFFLAQFDNEEIKKEFISALQYLADEGIGTDRHVGNGLFEFDKEEGFNFEETISSGYSINLSLFCPDSDEINNILNDDKVAYEIITRGGWITTPEYNTLRKKYIRMFKEGSVLKINKNIDGRVVNITPEKDKLPEHAKNIHPIYRVGKSIFLSVNL